MVNLNDLVKLSAEAFLTTSGKVTTLDIKNHIRNAFPHISVTQAEVSACMDTIYSNNEIARLTYTDNGTYREYYQHPVKPFVDTVQKQFTKSNTSRPKTISKTAAVDLIKSSAGKFLTVAFVKKNGSERVMNGTVSSKSFMTNNGYILFIERNKGKRSVDPRTLKRVSVKGKKYTVK